MYRFGKVPGLSEIWFGRFAPQQVCVGRIGKPAIDSLFDAGPNRTEQMTAAIVEALGEMPS